MPKTKKRATQSPKKPAPLYRQKPAPPSDVSSLTSDLPHAHPIAPAHFTLREDGTIESETAKHAEHAKCATSTPSPLRSGGEGRDEEALRAHGDESPSTPDPRPSTAPKLVFSSEAPFVRLYHGNSLELLDAIHARYGDAGRFDCIFADPPYFLSNGGITCHAGKMVKVDKGDWDKSRGPELNHEFNKEWLLRCQRVLKSNGTIWVSGTHHVIFSIGYAMQELGFKILNDIAWEKPNPPPNLSCRYFTHSTETILWAAKNEKSKHTFNYAAMKAVTGKQMKTVWTMSAPRNEEKALGRHPTQKPLALVERCILASTNGGDTVLDPFLGSGTTAIACLRLNRHFVGIELDVTHVVLARTRADREIVEIWLRNYQVRVTVSVAGMACSPLRAAEFDLECGDSAPLSPGRHVAQSQSADMSAHSKTPRPATLAPSSQIDLDLFADRINGSESMDETPQVPTERIFHETKFVFLSCAEVAHGSVVHTTIDVSLQEAWAKTPTGKKRETTHIVRCETEIFRVK